MGSNPNSGPFQSPTHYATVTEAITALHGQGYTADFNLTEAGLTCGEQVFAADDFEIADVYRYEGDTDPADEAAVFAIVSTSGLKGILVTGFGTSVEPAAAEILAKLHHRGK